MAKVFFIIFNGDILKAHDHDFQPLVHIPRSEPPRLKRSQPPDTRWRIMPGDGTFRVWKIYLIALY